MEEIFKLALSKGFKYEYSKYVGSEDYLLRVYSDEGEITARLTKDQIFDLGMEVT